MVKAIDTGSASLGMAAAAPFFCDAGNIDFFGTDGNPPAIILRLRIFGDGAPRIDASDIGEGIHVLFS